MGRNVAFGKGRGWRAEDERYRDLHLGPRRGARVGEYGPRETSEYSDAYYGPGDHYPQRRYTSGGYSREQEPYVRDSTFAAGVSGHAPRERRGDRSTYAQVQSYGDLHGGDQSWADLGAQSVHGGERGITDRPLSRVLLGSNKGRGPAGYRRSDERLREIVCERLTDEPRLDASDMSVTVENGEVTLTGTVHDVRAKWLAEEIAAECSHEAPVHNRLRTHRMQESSLRNQQHGR